MYHLLAISIDVGEKVVKRVVSGVSDPKGRRMAVVVGTEAPRSEVS